MAKILTRDWRDKYLSKISWKINTNNQMCYINAETAWIMLNMWTYCSIEQASAVIESNIQDWGFVR